MLSSFSLLAARDVALDAPDLDLDGAQEWADDMRARLPGGDVPPVAPEFVAVRDLELVDPARWPRTLELLAGPGLRAALVEPARVLLADGRTRGRAVLYRLVAAPSSGPRRPPARRLARRRCGPAARGPVRRGPRAPGPGCRPRARRPHLAGRAARRAGRRRRAAGPAGRRRAAGHPGAPAGPVDRAGGRRRRRAAGPGARRTRGRGRGGRRRGRADPRRPGPVAARGRPAAGAGPVRPGVAAR